MRLEKQDTANHVGASASEEDWRISKARIYSALRLAFVLFVALTVVGVVISTEQPSPAAASVCIIPVCGNGVCDVGNFCFNENENNCPADCGEPSEAPDPIPGCDGGKVSYRWNTLAREWERDFCIWLFQEVSHDPFDAIFGYKPEGQHWSYGQAIAYLMSQGFGQSQLDTFEEQVQALVILGLWDPETNWIAEGADLLFISNPPPDPGFLPWLPRR